MLGTMLAMLAGFGGRTAMKDPVYTAYLLAIWFFYLALLFIYEFLGDTHPVTYVLFFANTVWALYLLNRLVKFWKVTTAIRYGIPTAIIAWNAVEIGGRWHLYTEFWERPQDFAVEMSLLMAGVVIAAFLVIKTPANKKSELSRAEEDLAV